MSLCSGWFTGACHTAASLYVPQCKTGLKTTNVAKEDHALRCQLCGLVTAVACHTVHKTYPILVTPNEGRDQAAPSATPTESRVEGPPLGMSRTRCTAGSGQLIKSQTMNKADSEKQLPRLSGPLGPKLWTGHLPSQQSFSSKRERVPGLSPLNLATSPVGHPTPKLSSAFSSVRCQTRYKANPPTIFITPGIQQIESTSGQHRFNPLPTQEWGTGSATHTLKS